MGANTTKLDKSGRLLIPAPFRRALGIEAGDSVLLRLGEDGMYITTRAQALSRAQEIVRRAVPEDRSLVDELIADRRQEAKGEEP